MARKSRTRTEAMLERVSVRTQSVSSISNPISTAISWNIPVYSVDYFQNLLNKKLSQAQLINRRTETKNDKNIRVFENKYLKLEHIISHKYRPEFKEVSKWPSIDINTLLGASPFEKKLSKKSSRKEKNNADKHESQRMNRTCNKTANEAGYCEICALHYSDLSQHLTTSLHLKFTCNDKNYADLDNCIKTRSVEAFLTAHQSSVSNSNFKEAITNIEMGRNLRKSVSLHLNSNNENSSVTRSLSNAKLLADESLKQPLQVQCNGFTNYHLRKSAIKSDSVLMKSASCYNGKDLLRETRNKMFASCPDGNVGLPTVTKDLSHLSPVEEENLHRLRSRKSLLLPAILMGTTAEDKNKNTMSPHTPSSNHFLRSSSSPKSQCQYVTRNKQSGEDGTCKKSNVTSNSSSPPTLTRNSSQGLNCTRRKLNNLSPCDNENKKYSRLSLSPKNKEDMRPNGRPYKRKLSAVTSDEEEKPETRTTTTRASASPRQVPSYQCNKKVKNNVCNETENVVEKRQRKRMTIDEKFLQDNQEYYKVEMLRTKLRSTEFYCNQEISQCMPKKEESKPELKRQLEEPIIVRPQKIRQRRQSALQILNLEAENFMFGPPKIEEPNSKSENSINEQDKEENRKMKLETNCEITEGEKIREESSLTPTEKQLTEKGNLAPETKKTDKCNSVMLEKQVVEKGSVSSHDRKMTEKFNLVHERRTMEKSNVIPKERKTMDKCSSTPHGKQAMEKCNSMLQNSVIKQNGRRAKTGKKRRTQAEVFIHDNLDYYKFEISSSRLRHQNIDGASNSHGTSVGVRSCVNSAIKKELDKSSPFSAFDFESPSCDASTSVKVKEEVMTEEADKIVRPLPVIIRRRGKKKKRECADDPTDALLLLPAEPVPCDRVPKEEPENSANLTTTNEYSSCCDRPTPPDSIHFSFETIPCKEPWYKVFQRLDTCNESYIHIPNKVYFSRYREVPPSGNIHRRLHLADRHAATTNNPSLSSPRDTSMLTLLRRKRRSRFTRFIIDDKPRKSPRCHASTLAILSSLGRRRSRKLLTPVTTTTMSTTTNETTAVITSTSLVDHVKASSLIAKNGTQNGHTCDESNVNAIVPKIDAGSSNSFPTNIKSDLENRISPEDSSNEYQTTRLKEAVMAIAKEVDEHLIHTFGSDDCDDRYLKALRTPVEVSASVIVDGDKEYGDANGSCMQIDPEILQDEEFLKCVIGEVAIFDDMAAFFESSLRCSSMEVAQDEETVAPRSHDTFMRLYREHDFSCNSSDCGASSTCEFLGFAEDGRTVSRKRKRKRPNMTGWPHDRNKRKQIRTLRGGVRRNNKNEDVKKESKNASPVDISAITMETKVVDTTPAAHETVSEADSECTDDDIPLKEFVCRRKRRTYNSFSSTEENDTKIVPMAVPTPADEDPVTPNRRSYKITPTLINTKRMSQIPRRKSYLSSYATRKIR